MSQIPAHVSLRSLSGLLCETYTARFVHQTAGGVTLLRVRTDDSKHWEV